MSQHTTPRIYADFHKEWEEGVVELVCRGTFEDLQANGIELKDGLEVVLYMDDGDEHGNPDDLEVDAIIRFHAGLGKWVGHFDPKQFRHASDRQTTMPRGSGNPSAD